MTIEDIKKLVTTDDYSFLHEKPLGNNIILLGLGGSYAYGTNIETSDIDIRGIATNSAEDILTRKSFDQVVNSQTDTTIYSLEKILSLLSNCNPNTIEMLGLKPEHYIYITNVGEQLLANKDMFLSKKAVQSFAGYAHQQLYRLKQISVRYVDQVELEQHILNSINSAKYTFPDKYFPYPNDSSLDLYIDDAVNEEYEKEIFIDVNFKHYPLRDYKGMLTELGSIIKDYNTIGKRNKNAIEKNKISKHMMHLVRLYLMAFDLLEYGRIVTYRQKDHDFLMQIRHGKFIVDNKPTDEFFDMVDDLESKLDYWKEHTALPEKPDYKKINNFLLEVNGNIMRRYYNIKWDATFGYIQSIRPKIKDGNQLTISS